MEIRSGRERERGEQLWKSSGRRDGDGGGKSERSQIERGEEEEEADKTK